MNPIAA